MTRVQRVNTVYRVSTLRDVLVDVLLVRFGWLGGDRHQRTTQARPCQAQARTED